ncbi:hypothetical protein [Dactylosporangium sp. CA-139066]|uniref:hypothetical protein n=1 Tax=Dactylosporangium sp. CA-139066 TaxID=3239930 RepID=UPI003D934354
MPWEAVRARIDAADLDGLAEALAAATPSERPQLRATLDSFDPHMDELTWRARFGGGHTAAEAPAFRRGLAEYLARRGVRGAAILACTERAADAVRAAHEPWVADTPRDVLAGAAAVLLRVRGAAWRTTVARGLVRWAAR